MKRLLSSAILCSLFSINLLAQKNLLRGLLDLPALPPVSVVRNNEKGDSDGKAYLSSLPLPKE